MSEVSHGLDVYIGAMWFLRSKRSSNQFITFTWFLLNTCSHFESAIKATCTLVIQQTVVNCSTWYVEFEPRRLQPWRWYSFIHKRFIHNSSNVSQLETLRGPWKIPLFSSIFHKALSDGIMVCWYVLVKKSWNLLVWFSSVLWMFILHWVAFRQGLTALSYRVCFCPKSFISNERIGLKRKQANKFCISRQDNYVGGCRGWYLAINIPHPFPVWVMPPMQHPQAHTRNLSGGRQISYLNLRWLVL